MTADADNPQVFAGLEYQRVGAVGGLPVVVHHGLVAGSATAPRATEAAAARGIELIGVARPGYGSSAPAGMESVADWHRLVTPLLDELGVGRYGVWGVSAGAPYSYALAALDPGRVTGVAITSGIGLVNDPAVVAEYGEESRRAFEFFRTSGLDAVREFWNNLLKQSLETAPADSPFIPGVIASLANDGYGPGREAWLQQRPWGFDFAAIVAPVRMWHAVDDDMVPFATAQMISRLVPDVVFEAVAGESHIPTDATVVAALEFLRSRG